MSSAREAAFEALLKTEKEHSYSNIALDYVLSKTKLDTRDKSFVSALFYGTIERRLTIDYQLCLYLSKGLNKLKPEVLTILRMGAYQILYMDKIPLSAAVNESVKLSKKRGHSYASGLINAVLRKVGSRGIALPDEKDKIRHLSVKYSCPEEYIDLWLKELDEQAVTGILESSLGAGNIYIRVNTTVTTQQQLIAELEQEGVSAQSTPLENALLLELNGRDIEKLSAYKKGGFHVQDLSCQYCVKALDCKKGQRIFDMCSAPGGKAYTIAQEICDEGEVLCFDIHQSRVELIEKGAKRLGLSSVTARVNDASVFSTALGTADRVLCDVPCSGLGIIGKKPEIKYKKLSELEELPEIQYNILSVCSDYVRDGGILVYSTCTLLNRENSEVCDRFLATHKNFEVLPFDKGNKYKTFLPHINHSDGFFVAVFKKKDD